MRATIIAGIVAGAVLAVLPGCIARTAVGVVTAPVKVASKAADLATTSQSEADEKRGRELRRRGERLGKLESEWREQNRRCEDGDSEACRKREETAREIDALRPTIPATSSY